MYKAFLSFIVLTLVFAQTSAQKLAALEVSLKSETAGTAVPLSVNLDDITLLPQSELSLVEVKRNQRTPVPYQIENRGQRVLYWMVQQNSGDPEKRVFELIRGKSETPADSVQIEKVNDALVISANHKKLLQYNYKAHYPPAGVDTAFKRGGFIHPLWTPHGQSLTRIDAPDHYHHYGLWNPWTKVHFEGETIDFWNLKDRKGTVKFAGFVSKNEGPVYGGYQTLHNHIAFKKDGSEKTAINELQSVRIYQPGQNKDYYIADITIQLNCASESPVVLEEYRYGGLGWRATEKWNKDNSETLTSEGKTRKDADATKARWVIVQGSLDKDYGGAVMMSYPANYNFPEPLRIWPENANGRGDVFANFSPTRDKDWPLVPGRDYVLKYRFLVFNGKYSKEKAEAAWQYFAHPPKVSVKVYK